MFTTKAALDQTMKDDPFYNPDIPLSGVTFTDEMEKPDPFEQAEAVNSTISFKKFLAKPDRESVKELANQLGRPELIQELDPERRFKFFSGDWETEMLFRSGKWLCTATNQKSGDLKQFRLATAGDDKDSLMVAASKYLKTFAPPWRELTQDELITVSRMASGGAIRDIESALMTYLNFAGLESDISGDARYQDFCNDVCWFVFREAKLLDPETEDWMLEKLGGRPATINRLFALYEQWQFYKQKADRGLLFNPPSPGSELETPETIQAELDDLSDSTLADVYHQTARAVLKGEQ